MNRVRSLYRFKGILSVVIEEFAKYDFNPDSTGASSAPLMSSKEVNNGNYMPFNLFALAYFVAKTEDVLERSSLTEMQIRQFGLQGVMDDLNEAKQQLASV